MRIALHKNASASGNASDMCEALFITLAIFIAGAVGLQAYAASVTLSVNVQTSLAFTTSNQGFATGATNITPGTAIMATSTLSVTTNDSNGWIVTLSGDNKATGTNNLQSGANSIPDQTEWVNGAATSSAGNAVRIGSLASTGNVLAYRVMTASSTNGTPFYAGSWWGTTDSYLTDSATTLFAGISSSTVQRQIGNAGAGSYSASAHLNDVEYYLKVGNTQPTGSYTAPLTFTATGN